MSAHDTPEVGSGETVCTCPDDDCRETCPVCIDLADDAPCAAQTARQPASPDPVQPADAGEGLSEAERTVLLDVAYAYANPFNDDNPTSEWDGLVAAVERILAAREAAWAEKYAAVVRERESTASRWCTEHDEAAAECWSAHTTPAAAPEAKCEGLAPFCCNNPDCPVHGDRIDPAELDAARLVGDMAEAEVAELQTRAESAEAALATALREKAEDRARVEAADVEAVLTRHILHASMNVCLCGDWRAKSDAGSLAEQHRTHVARALRAALAIPTATGDE